MRYFMRLAYNGANFHGWQTQPNATTVQETIEHAMSTVLRKPISITGAGRTDAGVNAAMMIAHFDCDSMPDDTAPLVRSLNSLLGKNIAIYTIFKVDDDAHARFDATSRTYKYFAHTVKSPFIYPLSWQCNPKLLLQYTDFTSFSKLHTDVATNNCRITHAQWEPEGEQMVFTITADRFLRNMVRAIVGTLVDVGMGKITKSDFCRIIEQKDRCCAGTSMPGHALFLWDITYPFEIK